MLIPATAGVRVHFFRTPKNLSGEKETTLSELTMKLSAGSLDLTRKYFFGKTSHFCGVGATDSKPRFSEMQAQKKVHFKGDLRELQGPSFHGPTTDAILFAD
jgi:hypothetical protein